MTGPELVPPFDPMVAVLALLDSTGDSPAAATSGVVVGQSTENPLRKHLLTRGQVLNRRRPESLINETVDRGTTMLLFGEFGSFKSFLALDLAASVATGQPWNGRRCNPGPVLYVAAEGAWGQGERLRAWEIEHGEVAEDRIYVLERAVNLADPSEVLCLVELVQEYGFLLVVIDTLAKSAPGVNENSSTEMGVVVAALEQLRDATPGKAGAAVAVHHARKSSDSDGRPVARGSSAVEAGVDLVYRLSKANDGRVLVDRTKRKDGPEQDSFTMTLRPVGQSAVLDYQRSVGSPVAPASRVSAQERRYQERHTEVVKVIRQHQHDPDHAVDRVFIQRVTQLPKSTLRRDLDDLVAWQRIQQSPDGAGGFTYTTDDPGPTARGAR